MKNHLEHQDPELEALWGDSWIKTKPGLKSLGSTSAPVALKHRILNHDFSSARPVLGYRMTRIAAAAVAATLCAILVLRNHHAAPPIETRSVEALSDNDVAILSEAFDSDALVAGISFNLIDDTDQLDITPEDV